MPKFRIIVEATSEIGMGSLLAIASKYAFKFEVEEIPDAPEAAASQPAVAEATKDTRFQRLLSLAKEGQGDVLRQIKSHPKGITAAGMAANLGWDGITSVTGVMGPGLLRNIPKAGYQLEEIIVVKKGPNDVKMYLPGPVLVANDVPGPAKEET